MPNWCANRLRVTGLAENVRKVRALMRREVRPLYARAEEQGNRHHPTEKPVSVLQPLIETFTKPGDLVLDLFAGSGSTCVAADQCGRRWIGIELLEQYHAAGLKRIGELRTAGPPDFSP